jgi:hypothetical protein
MMRGMVVVGALFAAPAAADVAAPPAAAPNERCEQAFRDARTKLASQWGKFRKIDISRPKDGEVYAGFELSETVVYTANFRAGDMVTAPGDWKMGVADAERQFASGFGIVSLGLAHPFAPVPKSAVKHLGAFIAAFREAINRCGQP